MAPPADEFVRKVIDHLRLADDPRERSRDARLSGASALADKLRLGGNGYGTVRRWLLGETSPGYEETMEMLELAGWLNMQRPPLTPAEEERRSRLLAEAEAALARLREELG